MTVEKLKKVMLRCRSMAVPGMERVTLKQLKRAIMIECGTCRATWFNNKRALQDLGWIKIRKQTVHFTGMDLTEDFL